ncbi:MAG TPA: NAD(P)/FAD-dependent oxidoreductase [Candidatus Yaniella excrementigallinarum]|nr:NAD(P)/FAD-dependent oxidoreductase [Candidatus Yaniella excrementigallinarum]
MVTASVVGSGPNGLAAALTLAQAGVDVTVYEAADTPGGGARSGEMTLPGLLHDLCSGFHPLALDTAFSHAAKLDAYGLQWAWPEIQYAHPLDDGYGAAAYRSVADTAQHLGDASWQRVFGSLTKQFPASSRDFLQPMLHMPDAPLQFANFGLRAGLPAKVLATLLGTDAAKALFAGVAAHAFRPLGSFGSAAIGVALTTAGHTYGWPVAVGGSQAIISAMLQALEAHGGTMVTGAHITSIEQLPKTDIVMFNTAPAGAVEILGSRIPSSTGNQLQRFRHGPAAATASLAVEGGIPWTYAPARRAGTVHVGGSLPEIAFVERQITRGIMPRNPFVLVGQQSLADPSRTSGNIHPVEAYAHVPAGYPYDVTEVILQQIQRFAPGVRERIVAQTSRTALDLQAENPNFIGGDIATGSNAFTQLVFRPRAAINPYWLGAPGMYLCSAATPPGAGAHGMAGYNAAQSALTEAGF